MTMVCHVTFIEQTVASYFFYLICARNRVLIAKAIRCYTEIYKHVIDFIIVRDVILDTSNMVNTSLVHQCRHMRELNDNDLFTML